MENFFKSVLSVCLLLSIIGCSKSGSEGHEKKPQTFYLVVNDSIEVPYLGLVDLMDVDPQQELLLFHDIQQGSILLADFAGQHLLNLKRRGDSPQDYGRFLWSPARISPQGKIYLTSHRGYFEYDRNGELAKHTRLQQEVSLSGRAAADQEFQIYNGHFYQSGISRNASFGTNQKEFYDEFQLMVRINPENGELTRFLHLEEASVLKNGRGHDIGDMIPVFQIVNDHLYVIVAKDPHLNIYHLDDPGTLVKRVPLNYREFQIGEGQPLETVDPRMISPSMTIGKTYALKNVDDFLLTTYFPGIDRQDQEIYEQIFSGEEYRVFFDRMRKKYPYRLHITDLDGNRLVDMELPEKLDQRQFLVRDGKLWFLSRFNQETEEDFVKVYQVGLEIK
ncbi:hypothetical protein [Negadavirga shengliensis]|uniref:DUF4221 domain-containing protein n=1 Tax=Negadavirga shengliensis TaxID=1389218 RepID=A0ABV9SYC2_9BACT